MSSKYRQVVFVATYARQKAKPLATSSKHSQSKTNEGIKYLILKRKHHWRGWEFPKGGINFSESKKSAVRREILEETGRKTLKVKRFNFHGKYNYKKKFPERKDFIGQAYYLYAAEIKYGNVKIDKMEHSTYVWLSFDEAVKKVTFRNQKKSLGIVNKWLKNEGHQGSPYSNPSFKKKKK